MQVLRWNTTNEPNIVRLLSPERLHAVTSSRTSSSQPVTLSTGASCELRFSHKLKTEDTSAASHETDTKM